MNRKTAILSVRIIGDASKAVASFDQTVTASERFQRGVNKAAGIAVTAFAAVVAGMIAVGQAASELEQANGAITSIFGDQVETIRKYQEVSAQTVGLAKDQYASLAAVIGAQLRNMGVAHDEQAERTNQLIELGADLAAQFGGSTSDAVAALSSLLRGERDPIERYGVSIKQADIEARKAALGLTDLTGEAEKAADMQATLQLLIEQTSSAHGTFAREADTAAGQQQRANAAWRDAQAALGLELLPYMAEAARIAADLAYWIGENKELAQILAIGILILAGAIMAFRVAIGLATTAQWLFNLAAAANPVGLVVLIIIAALLLLGTIIWLLITYWEEFEQIAIDAVFAVTNALSSVVQAIEDIINALIEAIIWMQRFDVIGNAIRGAQGIQGPTSIRVDLPGSNGSVSGTSGTTINNVFNVSGALDANGTAKAIAKVQRTDGRATGRVGVGAV